MTNPVTNLDFGHELLHPYKGGGQDAPFEDFAPFIQVEGPEDHQRFTALLRQLYETTSSVWRPGACYSTPYLERESAKLSDSGAIGAATLSPRSYLGDCHFFMVAEIPEIERELIVDPFGVPASPESKYIHNQRLILPFFGDVALASDSHRRVYDKAKPLNEKRYRVFRP